MNETLIAVAINIIYGALVAILSSVYGKRKYLLVLIFGLIVAAAISALVIMWLVTPSHPEAQSVFSAFEQARPISNPGCHWGVFNDNTLGGNSNITIETQKRPERRDEFCILLSYYLGEKAQGSPYCGIFSGFSPKCTKAMDVSQYVGISFDAWHMGPVPEGTCFYIQLIPQRRYSDYTGFHQYEFTTIVRKDKPVRIKALFSEFVQPQEWRGERVAFSKDLQKELQQIDICIRSREGEVTQGKVFIDDIEFIK